MSNGMTYEQIVMAMTQQGIPPEKAERHARIVCGLPEPEAAPVATRAPASIVFPLRITLPWSALCSDNFHEKASLIRLASGEIAPRKVLDARYKAARDKTKAIVRELVGSAKAADEPLAIHALVYVPDERPHDVCNFAKCAHDALESLVYTNDRWLYRTLWERAGVDVDAPRAEIVIDAL